MSTLTVTLTRPGVLRQSPWDALLVFLAFLQGAVLLLVPSFAVVAVGVWWNSNTIAHNFVHRPFFRWRWLNALFALYLSGLLGVPQSIWRSRHLAHHAGVAWRLKPSRQMVAEVGLVLAVWGLLATFHGPFFLRAYLPGYALGLGLCWLQGHYEHQRNTISHYGVWYNLLFFNDGYHVEHHARPGAHWTALPSQVQRGAMTSPWPAVLRWLDALSLEGLERGVLHSAWLQRFLLDRHERAFRRLLPALLDLLGMPIPDGTQGRSLLAGPTSVALFCTDYSLGFLGLRDGRWKAIHELDSGHTHLYDLETDPDELRDVAAVYPERAEAYREHLLRWAAAQKYRLTKEW